MKNRYINYKNPILQICLNAAIYGMTFSSCDHSSDKLAQAKNEDWQIINYDHDHS